MSGMSILGSYSGIDQAAVDRLIEAESMPLLRMKDQKEQIGREQDAWKDVNSRLKSLFDKIDALKNPASFNSKVATSTNDKIVTMTANHKAVTGDYRINVKQLATNSRLTGDKIPGYEKMGKALDQTGKLTINYKTDKKDESGNPIEESVVIDVKATDSMKDIVDSINDTTKDYKDENGKKVQGSGIKATVVDGRLVLEDVKTGANKVDVSTSEGLDLGINGKETELGKKALFSVNGIDVERDSNNIDDVIDGVTISLKNVHKDTNETDMINVDVDYEKAEKAMQDFVDQYNSTVSFIDDITKAGDPEVKGSRGVLAGDNGLKRLSGELKGLVTQKYGSSKNDIIDISELGVTTKDHKSGALVFDKEKFKEVLKEDDRKVMNFFQGVEGKDGKPSTRGFSDGVNGRIDTYISTKNGIIKKKNESYDKTIKDLNKKMDDFTDRMKRKEEYYIKKFTELDTIMMNAESQMGWLQGQVNAMNGGK